MDSYASQYSNYGFTYPLPTAWIPYGPCHDIYLATPSFSPVFEEGALDLRVKKNDQQQFLKDTILPVFEFGPLDLSLSAKNNVQQKLLKNTKIEQDLKLTSFEPEPKRRRLGSLSSSCSTNTKSTTPDNMKIAETQTISNASFIDKFSPDFAIPNYDLDAFARSAPSISPVFETRPLNLIAKKNSMQFLKKSKQDVVLTSFEPEPKRRRLMRYTPSSSTNTKSLTPGAKSIAVAKPLSIASFVNKNCPKFAITNYDLDALARLMPKNENMVRKFPPKERTAKEQARRDKCTEASRLNRNKEKIKLMLLEKETSIARQSNMSRYLNELMKLGATLEADEGNGSVTKIAKLLGFDYLAKLPINQPPKQD